MASAKYEAVAADDEGHRDGIEGCHDSSARLTPDSDFEDDEDLEDLEAAEGYELQDLGRRSRKGPADEDDYESENESEERKALQHRRKRRQSSVASFELYTPDEERRVRRKLDTDLVLFVSLLYMMSFLDRSNIGNAKIAGLMDDLKLNTDQYEWLLTAFYIAYITFEWMTICYKLFPPHIYISCCVCAWGVLASLQALVTSFSALVALRALLGIGEAAFVGIPFYLSFFFRSDELALRVGLFIAAAPLATTFASSLAWAIVRFGSHTAIAPWRLLFLIEGFPACLVAVWAWWWIPDSPSTTRWLSPREKRIATLRMRREASQSSEKHSSSSSALPRHKRTFNYHAALAVLRDPIAYLTAGMFFCCNVAFSSMPVFMPTIITGMGASGATAQALSAPPFLVAFATVLATALVSDRTRSRSGPMAFQAALAGGGYVLATLAGVLHWPAAVRYVALFPICAGFFSAVTIVITWTVNNQRSDEGKGAGMAVLNVVGQMGPLVGTRLYPDSEGPWFVKGMAVCAGAMGVVFLLAVALRVVLKRKNERAVRERGGGRDGFMYII